MLPPLPEITTVEVPSELALELLAAAEALPLYGNEEFYAPDLQLYVSDQIRRAGPAKFCMACGGNKGTPGLSVPIALLAQGLQFDEGNKVFVALNRAFGELSDNLRTLHARTPVTPGASQALDDSQLDQNLLNGYQMQFAQIRDCVITEPESVVPGDLSTLAGVWVNSNPERLASRGW